jgi:hypothetical protein
VSSKVARASVPRGDGVASCGRGALDGRLLLRRALARAGITTGFEHRCRRHGCGHKEPHQDSQLRRCPVDGRKLWPVAQVRKITWHDLRHSTATLLKVAGVHLVDAQQILRHADPRTTQAVYTHVDTEALRPAVNKMPFNVPAANVDRNVDRGSAEVIRLFNAPKSSTTSGASERAILDSNQWPSAPEADALSI